MKKNVIQLAGIILALTSILTGCLEETPDAPRIIQIRRDNYNWGTKLIWNEVPGAKEYQIFYGYGSNPNKFSYLATTSETNYFHRTGETNYFYAVKASNLGMSSAFSNVVSLEGALENPFLPPASPSIRVECQNKDDSWWLNDVLNSYQIEISWEEIKGATKYIVYYGKGMDTSLFSRLKSVDTSYCYHNYKKDDGKYYYSVKASNSYSTSGFSNVETWVDPR